MSVFTKRALIEAFEKVLETKNFDKITIKDIIEESGVSRSTFYYHFADIFELAEATFEYECEQIIPDNITKDSWQEILLDATQLAKESRKLLYHAFDNIDRKKLEEYLYITIKKVLKVYVDTIAEDLDVKEEDKDFIITCYVCALTGMIIKWISEGMVDDANVFIKKMGDYFTGSIYIALKKTCTKR